MTKLKQLEEELSNLLWLRKQTRKAWAKQIAAKKTAIWREKNK